MFELAVCFIGIAMSFTLVSLFQMRKRVDLEREISNINFQSVRESQDNLWKDNDSLWAQTGDIRHRLNVVETRLHEEEVPTGS